MPWRASAVLAIGWPASFVRHKEHGRFPFPLALARNTATTYGARVVFPTVDLAVSAALIHGADGTPRAIKVEDKLYWAPGPAVPS